MKYESVTRFICSQSGGWHCHPSFSGEEKEGTNVNGRQLSQGYEKQVKFWGLGLKPKHPGSRASSLNRFPVPRPASALPAFPSSLLPCHRVALDAALPSSCLWPRQTSPQATPCRLDFEVSNGFSKTPLFQSPNGICQFPRLPIPTEGPDSYPTGKTGTRWHGLCHLLLSQAALRLHHSLFPHLGTDSTDLCFCPSTSFPQPSNTKRAHLLGNKSLEGIGKNLVLIS